MKVFGLFAVLVVSVFAHAEPRKPAQDYNPLNPSPGTTTGATAAFVTEDVVTAGSAVVQMVYCLGVGGSGSFSLNTGGNDIRITRVAANGTVVYEIRKGQRFVGACNQIQVMSR